MEASYLRERPHYTIPVKSIKTQDCAKLILLALEEDAPDGDPSSESIVKAHSKGCAHVLAKEEGLICGLALLDILFQLEKEVNGNSISYNSNFQDGQKIRKGDLVLTLEGAARAILRLERIILNFLQHLSGISSHVNKAVQAVGSEIIILDTRKTLPGFRRLAKYAVYCGGGTNHRLHLSDMLMLKDNHIALAGSISKAVLAARTKFPDLALEVEVENREQFEEALALDVDMILLDNMSQSDLEAVALKMSEKKELCKNKPFLELSGNWDLEGLRRLKNSRISQVFQKKRGQIGVSMGALTHSSPFLDLSMRLDIKNEHKNE